jgi:prepilin-type processing-associated H-X9-DG protein
VNPGNVLNPKYPNSDYKTGGGGPVNLDGVMHIISKTRAGKVTDGLSKTLLLGERWYQLRTWTVGAFWFNHPVTRDSSGNPIPPREPVPDSNVNSAKNVDARYPPNAKLPTVSGCYQLHKPDHRPPECSVGGVPKNMTYNDLLWGSFHTGGSNFAYADGSVEFIGEDISPQVWVAKASRNGDEVVNAE